MVIFTVLGFSAQLVVIASVISAIISCASLPHSCIVVTSEDHPTGAELSVSIDESDATLSCATSYCAKSMMSPVITTTISDDVITNDYSALTIRQLKALCRERHIKGYSSLRKHELVALLSAL